MLGFLLNNILTLLHPLPVINIAKKTKGMVSSFWNLKEAKQTRKQIKQQNQPEYIIFSPFLLSCSELSDTWVLLRKCWDCVPEWPHMFVSASICYPCLVLGTIMKVAIYLGQITQVFILDTKKKMEIIFDRNLRRKNISKPQQITSSHNLAKLVTLGPNNDIFLLYYPNQQMDVWAKILDISIVKTVLFSFKLTRKPAI